VRRNGSTKKYLVVAFENHLLSVDEYLKVLVLGKVEA